jgi:hypothetical protein
MEILIPLEGTSPTGLQAKELMGLTVNSINELSDSDVDSFEKFYEELYVRAYRSFTLDLQKVLSGIFKFEDGTIINGRFNFNKKVSSLETSQFINAAQQLSGEAGVRIVWAPSMYSVIQINKLYVNIKTLGAASPDKVSISVVDNETGFTLYTKEVTGIVEGLNAIDWFINVNVRDFSILIDLADNEYFQSKQRFFYGGSWIDEDLSCSCTYGSSELISYQVNGGGVNAKLTAICSIDKFIEQNFGLFSLPLYYSIGREFMKERVASDRVNEYTLLTIDRANQLLAAYEKDYMSALESLRNINNIAEDYECFSCKKAIYSTNLLP